MAKRRKASVAKPAHVKKAHHKKGHKGSKKHTMVKA